MSYGYSPGWRRFSIVVLRPLLFAALKRDWRGRRHVPRDGGLIVASNHISETDPLALAHFVYESGRYPVYLAKSTLFKVRGLGLLLRKLGQIPVHRGSSDAAQALQHAEEGLRAGQCLMFYPEGTCTRDPELWPMTGQTGAARLALTTGATVLPVATWGTHELLPYKTHGRGFHPFPRKTIKVIAGPPVDLSAYKGKPLTGAVLHAATDEIMQAIAALLGELRGQEPPAQLYDRHKALQQGKPGEETQAS